MRRLAGLLCLCALAVGCAADSYDLSEETTAGAAAEPAAAGDLAAKAGGEAAQATGGDVTAAPGVKPRIIYSADVRLVAEDFAAAQEKLGRLVDQVGGYVADAREDRTSGSSRYGQWTVRVPVAKFDSFLASLDAIGFVESRNKTSEDVTMEYVDTQARISNLQRLEERYVTLLADQTGSLEDVLKVEQELARIRGDIEQAQGRLRYLTNKTDYSSVTITVREEKDYVPPKAPTFAERVGTTWSESLAALRKAGEVAVLAVVALAPWAAVAVVPVLAVAATVRLAMRRKVRPSAP
jgi:hypothetical protein